MNEYLVILTKALEDPLIENLDGILPKNKSRLLEIIEELPSDGCISEWRYGVGEIKYQYHIHTNGISRPLKELFEKGVSGGGPRKLTAVYCKEELQKIIQEFEVDL